MRMWTAITLGVSLSFLFGCNDSSNSPTVADDQDTFPTYAEYLDHVFPDPRSEADTNRVYYYMKHQPLSGIAGVREYYDKLQAVWEGNTANVLAKTSEVSLAVYNSHDVDEIIPVDKWKNISYCFYYSGSAPAALANAKTALKNAAASWASGANNVIAFPYLSQYDGANCSSKAYFYVDLNDIGGWCPGALGCSTIPRYSYQGIAIPHADGQSVASLQETFVHELGHILGFVHEFALPGGARYCRDGEYGYAGVYGGDVTGIRPLTAYDAGSVMNYSDCGGSNPAVLSALDKAGVKRVYTNTSAPTWSMKSIGFKSFNSAYDFGMPNQGFFTTRAGDFDGDGNVDFLRASYSTLFTFYGNGNGTFSHTSPTSAIQGSLFVDAPTNHASVYPLFVADFNGDGRDDVIRYHNTKGIWVFLSIGRTFATPIFIAHNTGYNFSGFAAITGDWQTESKYKGGVYETDASDDLLFVSNSCTALFRGGYAIGGGANFKKDAVSCPGGAGFGDVSTRELFRMYYDHSFPSLVAFQADHMIVAKDVSAPVKVFYSSINGGSAWNFGAPSAFTTVSGDFNGDGFTDYCRLSPTSYFSFMQNNGSFTATSTAYPAGWNFGWNQVYLSVAGDFNGDHRTDILRTNATSAFPMLSNGNGTFTITGGGAIGTGYDFGSNHANEYETIVGDFNGNGKTDVIRMNGAYYHLMQF